MKEQPLTFRVTGTAPVFEPRSVATTPIEAVDLAPAQREALVRQLAAALVADYRADEARRVGSIA